MIAPCLYPNHHYHLEFDLAMNTIKILGVEGHRETELLVNNVRQALGNLNLRLGVEVVDDVTKLMESKIAGIPALIVRGQVVAQQGIPHVPDLQLLFQSVFLSKKNRMKMKKILVPTDFSPAAKCAFDYANALARRNHSSMHVLNVHYPNVGAVDAHSSDLFSEGLEFKKKQLDRFVNGDASRSPAGEVVTTTKADKEVMIGFPGEAIIERSAADDVDMIVMGKTGESGILEKMFGSISSDVARQARCPVLLVPNGATYNGIQRVLYATDFHAADEAMIEELVAKLGGEFADVHFVHIDRTPEIEYKVSGLNFETTLAERLHVVNIESKDVMEGISRYATENRIDLVVIATSHRPFFENLFHKSLTKKLAINTDLPLLVMHFDD